MRFAVRQNRAKALLAALLWMVSAAPASIAAPPRLPPAHTFSATGGRLLLDGRPIVLRAGEMHFQRIPRAYWRDRLRMERAMGLNTVSTYLFWNSLEPKPGVFDFGGNNDIAEFVREAQAEGLWVLLRPGPYACAEWDFGGLPSWLLQTPGVEVRTRDPRFLEPATRYLAEVGARLADLQIGHGGPILMTQVENEYGSFGNDKAYLGAIEHALRAAGFDGLLYTADGGDVTHMTDGSLPDALIAANLGENPAPALAALAQLRPDQPPLVGEYYPGWFDHWGEPHHTGDNAHTLPDIEWLLAHGASFNIYMFHGGTSFGFMNGANYSETEPYQPDTTSYDYAAPLDEGGRSTAKYRALRALIEKYLPAGEKLPNVPAPPRRIALPRIALRESASLWSLLGEPVRAERPSAMEALDQAYGFALYRTTPTRVGRGELVVDQARDYALVYQHGKSLGVLDRRRGETALLTTLDADAPLDILIENMGRINYGARMLDGRAGLVGRVQFRGAELSAWQMYTLPLDDLSALNFSLAPKSGPQFFRGRFTLRETGDTWLDLRGWDKGHVWINGHHLGRYWHIGPQRTLFVPQPWLVQGGNEVIVLDEQPGTERSVRGLREPVFGGTP